MQLLFLSKKTHLLVVVLGLELDHLTHPAHLANLDEHDEDDGEHEDQSNQTHNGHLVRAVEGRHAILKEKTKRTQLSVKMVDMNSMKTCPSVTFYFMKNSF